MAKDADGNEIVVNDDDNNMPDDDTDLQDADDLKDPPAFVAPSQEEWTRTTDALKKANNQARKLRQEKRAALANPAAVNNGTAASTGTAADIATAVAKGVADATTASEKKWKPRIVTSAAKTALVEAGLVGSPDRLLKMLDHDDIDVDEDGEVSGLDDQIADLKADYPELFTKKIVKTSVDGGRRTVVGGSAKKSSADLIAERFGASK